MRRALLYVLGVLAMLALSASHAGAQCRAEVTGISFGKYDVYTDSPVYAEGTVTVSCDKNRLVEVGVSTGGSGTFFPRQLAAGPGQTLAYNVYTTSGYSTIWGDDYGAGTGTQWVLVLKKRPGTLTLFGRIPAGQDVPAGQYGDTLTVTVNY